MQKVTANLMVEDVNRTIDFCQKVLGFEVVMAVPETGRLDWVLLKNGGVELMFQSRESLAAELPVLKERTGGGPLTFYIETTDLMTSTLN